MRVLLEYCCNLRRESQSKETEKETAKRPGRSRSRVREMNRATESLAPLPRAEMQTDTPTRDGSCRLSSGAESESQGERVRRWMLDRVDGNRESHMHTQELLCLATGHTHKERSNLLDVRLD